MKCLTYDIQVVRFTILDIKQDVRVVFSEQECDLVVVTTDKIEKLKKLCSVHMTVFEIVVHRNVNNWIQSLARCILAQTTHP